MMNVSNWEQPKTYRAAPLPTQIEYSKAEYDLKHYLDMKVRDEREHEHDHYLDARMLKRPLAPINMHHDRQGKHLVLVFFNQ